MRTPRPNRLAACKRPRFTDRLPHLQLRRWRALTPLVALLLLLGCDEKEKAAAPSATPSQAPAVVVVPAARQPVSKMAEFVGRVEALEKVEIRARVTGFLRDRHFREGQLVKEGDVL